ncbi:hypothetical protein [Bacillus nitroreducens]
MRIKVVSEISKKRGTIFMTKDNIIDFTKTFGSCSSQQVALSKGKKIVDEYGTTYEFPNRVFSICS